MLERFLEEVDEAVEGRCWLKVATRSSARAVIVRPAKLYALAWLHHGGVAESTFPVRRVFFHLPRKLRDILPTVVAASIVQLGYVS